MDLFPADTRREVRAGHVSVRKTCIGHARAAEACIHQPSEREVGNIERGLAKIGAVSRHPLHLRLDEHRPWGGEAVG